MTSILRLTFHIMLTVPCRAVVTLAPEAMVVANQAETLAPEATVANLAVTLAPEAMVANKAETLAPEAMVVANQVETLARVVLEEVTLALEVVNPAAMEEVTPALEATVGANQAGTLAPEAMVVANQVETLAPEAMVANKAETLAQVEIRGEAQAVVS